MPRSTPTLVVTEDQQRQIEQWFAALGTPRQVALRCRIVLFAGRGESESAIADRLQVNRKTVRLWRDRFCAEGLSGLWEIAPGRGRNASYGPGPNQSRYRHDPSIQAQGQQLTGVAG